MRLCLLIFISRSWNTLRFIALFDCTPFLPWVKETVVPSHSALCFTPYRSHHKQLKTYFVIICLMSVIHFYCRLQRASAMDCLYAPIHIEALYIYILLMATHSSTLAWKILWTEEPGRMQSMGSLRVGHDWATSLSLFTFMHWRRKWQPTPVFLPGESQGQRSLLGCCLWGRTELDTTDKT